MIGIIGSGNLGANTALFLAERGIGSVKLFDLQGGIAAGKALDLMEAAPLRAYRCKVERAGSLDEVGRCEVILVAAGAIRQPGIVREELLEQNLPLILSLAHDLSGSQAVIIIATEPVDLLTAHFIEESGLSPKKVMGLGGALDSIRLRYLLSRELSVSAEDVTALVIGRHTDAMIPLRSYCRVSGLPASQLISEERLEELFEETRRMGAEIVELAGRSSAYYGPSAAAAELIEAILKDSHSIFSVSLRLSGQYGVDGVAVSLPAVIYREGIERILEPSLTEREVALLRESATGGGR